jgi:hypothetical protein
MIITARANKAVLQRYNYRVDKPTLMLMVSTLFFYLLEHHIGKDKSSMC